MKITIKYFLTLNILFILNLFTSASDLYADADGAVFEQKFAIVNATLNGIPVVYNCGQTAYLGINSTLEFDISAYANNDVFELLDYSFSPPVPPGTFTFSPSLPYSRMNYVFSHFIWNSPTPYLGVLDFVVSDQYFTVHCSLNFDVVLPVELSSFNSSVNNNNVNLKWTTASETNNSGFDVERRDARSETQDVWNKISFINGHGTTASLNNYEFSDRNLSSGKYKYRLKQIDFNGNFEYYNLSNEVVIGVPEKFELSQNYPNPFNPSTVISYSLSENSFVILKVYDVVGNEVATLVSEKQNSGIYNYQFSTVNYQLSSGVYFYKIEAGSFSAVKRMILIK